MKIINHGVGSVRRAEAKTNPLLKGMRYTVVAMQMRETFLQLYQLDDVHTFEQKLREWCTWVEASECHG